LFHAQHIRRPLAVFQGDLDRVVPRAQSDRIVEAVKQNGVACVYRVFADEGHGWRKEETIEQYYREVEEFLTQHVIYT
jgi:dipeptidyl aminopeptidase/acylaminoacyl peptidase